MDRTAARYLLLLAALLLVAFSPVMAHSPSDLRVSPDPDASGILITLDHRVDDPTNHYVKEVVLEKNGIVAETFTYTSQPSKEPFSYRYILPLKEGDVIRVTARCNLAGSVTRSTTVRGVPATDGKPPVPAATYAALWPVHAALMGTAFLCFFIAVLFPALRRGKGEWFRNHARFAATGAVLALIALGIAFFMVAAAGGPHVRVPHAFSGLLVLVLLLATVSLALLRTRLRAHTLRVLAAHRWLGRALLIAMVITIALGLVTAGLIP